MVDVRLANTQAEAADWNHFVEEASATPYARMSWLTAIEQAYGHTPKPLAAFEHGKLAAVLPLIQIKTPFKGASLVSLPFCDVGGCIGPVKWHEPLIEQARQLAHETGARSLALRSRLHPLGFDFKALEQSYQGRKVSMIMPLESSSEALLARFKPKLRSQIKKAMKNGLSVEIGQHAALIDDFYRIFSRNMRLLGSPVHAKALFEHIVSHYGAAAKVAVVYLNGEATAAGIVLTNGKLAAIPWASALVEYNRLAPNMLLYWSLLAECADEGIETFDFGRSTFNEGTFQFKKQWGAEPWLLDWKDVLSPGTDLSSEAGWARSLAENAWRRLPLGVTTHLGPRIRKFISL